MKEVIVLLDNVRSALNVGAIFRTCDGAGVKELILSGITPYPPHPKVIKTSIGAEEHIKFEYLKDPKDRIVELKKEGFVVVSIEQTPKSKDFFREKLPEKVLIIMGNELTGVSSDLLKLSDLVLELPMNGVKNSLNVATTTGIVLYNTTFSRHEQT